MFSCLVKDLARMMTRLVLLPPDQHEQSDIFETIPDCEYIILMHVPFDSWSQATIARLFECFPASLTTLFLSSQMAWRSGGGVSLRHLVNLRLLLLHDNYMHRDMQGLLAALQPNLVELWLDKIYIDDDSINRFTQEQVQQLIDGVPHSVTELVLRRDIGIELGSLNHRDGLSIEFVDTIHVE